MFKVTFRFENGETVEGFAAAEENLLEVARKTKRRQQLRKGKRPW